MFSKALKSNRQKCLCYSLMAHKFQLKIYVEHPQKNLNMNGYIRIIRKSQKSGKKSNVRQLINE